MTLLQSRKSKWGLTAIWDTVSKVKPATRPGLFSNPAAYDSPEVCSGTLRFWKRQGWRFYPVNIRYMWPATSIPANGFPVIAFCLDQPTAWNSEWESFTNQLCLNGSTVIIVKLPTTAQTTKQQAQIFLKATWLTLAIRIGALADTPVRLSWCGTDSAAPVVEQASRLRQYKYYLPPENIFTKPFNDAEPAQAEVAGKELEWVTV